MAALDPIVMTIELSPELKEAFAKLNERLDLLNERLNKIGEPKPITVSLSGSKLVGALQLETDRMGRVIGRDQAIKPAKQAGEWTCPVNIDIP